MKYLIHSVLVLTMILITIGTHAQSMSSYYAPYVGATHTYTITDNSGNTYTWYVTTDAEGKNKLPSGGDFVLGAPTGSTTDGTNVMGKDVISLPVTWNSGAAGKTYYLQVEEKAANGCTNRRALTISPIANAFNVLIADVSGTSNPAAVIDPNPATNGISINACATPPTPKTGSDGKIIDDNGTTILQFKIWMIGSTNDWIFDYAITQTGTAGYDAKLTDSKGNTLSTDKTKNGVLVTNSTKDNNYCLLTLTVTNKPGEKQSFKVDLANEKDNTYGTLPSNANYKTAIHTIELMPNTSTINGN